MKERLKIQDQKSRQKQSEKQKKLVFIWNSCLQNQIKKELLKKKKPVVKESSKKVRFSV